MSALDDTRQFWIFTCAQGHAIGVLTQHEYDYRNEARELPSSGGR